VREPVAPKRVRKIVMKSLLANRPIVVVKTQKRTGRPPKINRKNFQVILAALRKGMSRSAACQLVKVSPRRLYDRMKTIEKVRQDVEAAEAHAQLHHVGRIFDSKDSKDNRWWLSHHPQSRKEWGDNQGGVNVRVGVGVAMPAMPSYAEALAAATANPRSTLAQLYPSTYGERAPRAIAETSESVEEIVDGEVRPLSAREVIANLRGGNTTS
jgi:hypothetical protein